MDKNGENQYVRLNELKEVITHHVEEDEENEIFEKSRGILGQQKAEELAQEYLEYKNELHE